MAKEKLQKIYQNRKNEPTSSVTSNLGNVYVPTKFLIEDKITKEKHSVSIKELLRSKDKVLIEGESGSGKSTLTNQILNDDQFFPEEIKYKFKVKLQLLLQENWKVFYGQKYLDNPVACFIHYSLTQLINRDIITASNRVSIEEIEGILTENKEQTLLLLDGYDTVARFDEKDLEIRSFINELLQSTKYSIMTSRPYFLNIARENYFKLKVQMSGFDDTETEIFLIAQQTKLLEIIDTYFKQHEGATEKDLLVSLRSSTDQINLEAYFILNQIIIHYKSKMTSPMSAAAKVEKASQPEQSVTEAINLYYQSKKIQLSALLTSPAIRELASNPMQAKMLCAAISDPEISKELTSSVTVHKLYKIITNMIGKRFAELNDRATESENKVEIIDLPEFKALREIAYLTFESRRIINGERVEEIAQKFGTNIQSLIKTGLLKTASKVNDHEEEATSPLRSLAETLLAQEYTFIHQSFHEFLTAYHIKKLLLAPALNPSTLELGPNPSIEEAAQLIAHHRNEPQYLLLLKFIAGMLSNKSDSKEATFAITEFWSAIESNIDGVLELGVDKKIILFMHLLAQTKHDGEIDSRIPNLVKVIWFIDKVVLSNFIMWQEKLKESGYLSPKMIEYLWNTLGTNPFKSSFDSASQLATLDDSMPDLSTLKLSQDQYDEKEAEGYDTFSSLLPSISMPLVDSRSSLVLKDESPSSDNSVFRSPNQRIAHKNLQKKAIIEIAGNWLHKLDNLRLYEALLTNIKSSITDWVVMKSSIHIITKIILNQEENFVISTNSNSIETILKLIDFIQNANLREASINAVKAFISINPTNLAGIELILDKLITMLQKGVNDHSLNKLIYNVLTQIPNTEKYLSTLLDLTIHNVEVYDFKVMPDMERSQSDEKDFLDFTSAVHDSALSIITELLQSQPNTIHFIVTRLIAFLETGSHKETVADLIGKILMINSSDTQKEIFSSIMLKLKDEHTKTAVINAINAVIDNQKISEEFSKRLLAEFMKILIDLGDADNINQFNIISAIIKITKISPNLDGVTRESIFTNLLDHQKIPNTLLALTNIVNINNLAHVQVIFGIITAKIAQSQHLDPADEEALLTLTSKNIAITQTQEFLSTLRAIPDTPNFIVLPIANLVIKLDGINDETLGEIGTNLIAKINQDNYFKIISALSLIMSKYTSINTSYIEALMNQLENVSSSLYIYVKCQIVKLIAKNINLDSSHLRESILLYSFSLLSDENSDKATLVKAIGTLLIKAPTHIMSHTITEKIFPLLARSDHTYISVATSILSKILINSDIPSEDGHDYLLQRMIFLLKNYELDLNALSIIVSILQRLEKDRDHDYIKLIFDQLISSIPSNQAAAEATHSQVEAHFAYIVSKMIDKIDKPTDETLLMVLSKLRNIQDHSLLEDTKDSMHKIIGLMSIEHAIKLLRNSCPVIRTSVIKVLTQKLSVGEIGGLWSNKILNLLNIIGNDIESLDQEVLGLYDAARRKLLDLCREMDEAEVNLEWVVQNFEKLVKTSKIESEKMMELIFYYVLSDNKITSLEASYIQKCVLILGFTLTISIPQTTSSSNDIVFTIQYASRNYELHGEENREHIETIASIVLTQNNILIQQYLNHEPFFPNKGLAIEPAAIDIAKCSSFIDGSNLSKDSYKLSFLYLSDDIKSSPNNHDQFVLLETRHAGYYAAHKIYVDQAGRVHIKFFKQHPSKLGLFEFRTKIFGAMDYGETNPRYYSSKPFSIDHEQGENLLTNIKGDTIKTASTARPIHHRTWSILDLRSSSSPPSDTRKTSVDRDTRKKAVDDPMALHDLINLIKKHITIPTGITGVWEIDSKNFLVLRRDQIVHIDVDRKESNERFQKVLLANHDLSKKAEAELAKIDADPYKHAFRIEIIQLINSVYIAALSDKAGMMDTHDPDSALNAVGSAAVSSSSYIPVVGVGVAILGQMLQGLSEAEKAAKLANLRKFFETPDEVGTTIAKVARELALLTWQIDQDNVGQVISTAKQILQGGVKTVTSMAASAVKGSLAEKEDENATKGQNDGAIIGNFMIRIICNGEYNDFVRKRHYFIGNTERDLAHLLIGSVKEHFTQLIAHEASDNHLPPTELGSPMSIDSNSQSSKAKSPVVDTSSCTHHRCIIMAVPKITYDNFVFNSPEYEAIFKLPKEKQTEALKVFHEYAHDIAPEARGEFLNIFSKLYLETTTSTLAIEGKTIVAEYTSSSSITQNADVTNNPSVTTSFFEIFSLSDLLNPGFLLKKLLYQNDLKVLYKLLDEKGVKVSINSEKDFKKIFLKVHPDKKGGVDSSDFKFARETQDKFKQNIWEDLYKALEGQFKTIESALHKTGISFKILDTGVDTARFILNPPTVNNGKAVLLDLNYLYTMNYGANKISLAINSADIGYKIYQGKIGDALVQAGITAGYMIVPTIIVSLGGPQATLAYSAVITGHSGYQALQNAYSFYIEQTINEENISMTGASNTTEAIE